MAESKLGLDQKNAATGVTEAQKNVGRRTFLRRALGVAAGGLTLLGLGAKPVEAQREPRPKDPELPANPETARAASAFIREVVDLSTDPTTKELIEKLDTDPSPMRITEGGLEITDLAGNPLWYEVNRIGGTPDQPLMTFARIRNQDGSFHDTVTYRKDEAGRFIDVKLNDGDKGYSDGEQIAKLSQTFPGLDTSKLTRSMGMFENGGFGTVNYGPWQKSGKIYTVGIDVVGRIQITNPSSK